MRLDATDEAVVAALDAAERAAAADLPTDDPLDPERHRRVLATGPELRAQPEAVRATWAANEALVAEWAQRLAAGVAAGRLRRVLLVGAGDSLAVMASAVEALQAGLGVPCQPLQSLDAALYPPPDLGHSTLVIAASSSGRTTRTVQALLRARATGATTLAVTNTPGSPLAEAADATFTVQATRIGWPTQSSTAALALLLRLAATSAAPGASADTDTGTDASALHQLPALMAEVVERLWQPVADIALRGRLDAVVVFSGGGPDWGSAVMGAAKVRECTPGHALAVQVEEFHHYNSLKAGESLWLLAPAGRCLPRAVDTAREARRWGGRVHVVTTVGTHVFDDLADDVLTLPRVPEPFSALLTVLPAQLVGYHLALAQFAEAASRQGAVRG